MNNDTKAKWREFNDEFGSLFLDSEIYVDSCRIPTHYRDTFFMVYLAAYKKREEEIARLREALDKHRDFYSRFWSKVNVLKKNECWEWLSSISPNGYGKFSIDNYPYSSHVLSYKFYNDDYDENLCIDHICMNRKCVNPRHLRQVTAKINNTENSNGTAALNKRKTHCPAGHEYSGGNLIIKKTKTGEQRRCRICVSETTKRARQAIGKESYQFKPCGKELDI